MADSISEFQEMPLKIWSRVLSLIIFSQILSSEKQLWACYWAFMRTEYLAIEHQITMWSEQYFMNWDLLDSLSHEIRHS